MLAYFVKLLDSQCSCKHVRYILVPFQKHFSLETLDLDKIPIEGNKLYETNETTTYVIFSVFDDY